MPSNPQGEVSPWLALFDQINQLYVSLSQLFKDCDRLMDRQEFICANKNPNTVVTELSWLVSAPESWLPGWFARFYRPKGDRRMTLYIAIFLSDRGKTEDYPGEGKRLEEPLIVAGVIRYFPGREGKWDYRNCKSWFWSGGEVNGQPVKKTFSEENRDGQSSNTSFAVRLENVKDLKSFENCIIEPLMRLCGEARA